MSSSLHLLSLDEPENVCPYGARERRPGGDDRLQVGVHVWCTRRMRQTLGQVRNDCGIAKLNIGTLRGRISQLRARSGICGGDNMEG